MVQRLNISIPDALHERLQRHKDKMNISQICQEAITEAVDMEDIKEITGDERKAMIERLRKEKEELFAHWERRGKEQGIRDATNEMSYSTFRAIQKAYDLLSSHDGRELDAADAIPDWVYEEWHEVRVNELKEEEDVEADTYLRGWLDGVTDVWADIEKEI